MRFLSVLGLAALLSLPAAGALAQADGIPAKTIRIVVPLGAGSAPDVIARKLAAHLGASLNKPVIVENKPGASGFIGGQDVVRSPGDGSSLYVSISSFVVITPQVFSKTPYDPMKDLKPIAQLAATPMTLSVAANSRHKNLADLVEAAKAAPDKLSFGSFGNGTAGHLLGEEFNRVAGIRLMHVPYKASATPDLVAGVIDASVSDLGSVKPYLGASPVVRVLGVTGKQRSPAFPGIPTFGEQGFKALDGMVGWLGVFAPPTMPAEVANQLSAAILKAVADPEVRSAMELLGYQSTGVAGAPFEAIVRADYQRWGAVIKAMGGLRLD